MKPSRFLKIHMEGPEGPKCGAPVYHRARYFSVSESQFILVDRPRRCKRCERMWNKDQRT